MADKLTKEQKKKRTAIAIAVCCVICVIGLFFLSTDNLSFNFDFIGTKPSTNEKEPLRLCRPDWEENIFENRRWLDENRYITYIENGLGLTLVDEDYEPYGAPIVMFAEYFDALMHGDHERVNSFYADSYFESHERFEKMTMQKIYNIKIEYIASSELANSTKYVYKLTYAIMDNDGTFRDDVLPEGERAQYYTLIDDGEVKITDVSYNYSIGK